MNVLQCLSQSNLMLQLWFTYVVDVEDVLFADVSVVLAHLIIYNKHCFYFKLYKMRKKVRYK